MPTNFELNRPCRSVKQTFLNFWVASINSPDGGDLKSFFPVSIGGLCGEQWLFEFFPGSSRRPGHGGHVPGQFRAGCDSPGLVGSVWGGGGTWVKNFHSKGFCATVPFSLSYTLSLYKNNTQTTFEQLFLK